MWTLEELDLRGNTLLNITDRMKVRVLLPRIQILGKEILYFLVQTFFTINLTTIFSKNRN